MNLNFTLVAQAIVFVAFIGFVGYTSGSGLAGTGGASKTILPETGQLIDFSSAINLSALFDHPREIHDHFDRLFLPVVRGDGEEGVAARVDVVHRQARCEVRFQRVQIIVAGRLEPQLIEHGR